MTACPRHPGIDLERHEGRCPRCHGVPPVMDASARAASFAGLSLDRLPSVIAFSLADYLVETEPLLRLWHMCDTIELALRLLVTIGLADIASDGGDLPEPLRRELAHRIEEPTLGRWRGMALALGSHARPDALVPEVPALIARSIEPLLVGDSTPATSESSLAELRNRLAHGGGVRRELAERLFHIHAPRFESALTSARWLQDLELVARCGDGNLVRLLGTGSPPPRLAGDRAAQLADRWNHEDAVLLVRGPSVLSLWPLAVYGIPRSPADDGLVVRDPVPQVYVRRDVVRLLLTPVGSTEIAESAAGDEALTAFLKLFQRPAHATRREVAGFEDDLRRDASRSVGRRSELATLREALAKTESGVLWVTGPAGIGKSFLVATLCAALLDEPSLDLVLPYRFKVGDARCSRESFLRFACERLREWPGLGSPAATEPRPRSAPREELRSLLARVGNGRVVLVLDGLDEIAGRDASFVEEVPLAHALPGVVWLCAGRPEAELVALFSPTRSRHVFPRGVPEMGPEDVRAMLLEKLGPLRRRLLRNDVETAEDVVNPFVDLVVTRARGLPIYVKYVVGDVLSGHFRVLDAHERLPPSLDAYHAELLRRLRVGSLHQVLTPIAATLAIAKEPLTDAALHLLLVKRRDVVDGTRGHDTVVKALAVIGTMLRRVTTPDGREGYTLFHHSLREHMLASEDTCDAVETARTAIEDAVLDWRQTGGGAAADYLFRWGVDHLMDRGRRDDAVGLLASSSYLEHRLSCQGEEALQARRRRLWLHYQRLLREVVDLGDLATIESLLDAAMAAASLAAGGAAVAGRGTVADEVSAYLTAPLLAAPNLAGTLLAQLARFARGGDPAARRLSQEVAARHSGCPAALLRTVLRAATPVERSWVSSVLYHAHGGGDAALAAIGKLAPPLHRAIVDRDSLSASLELSMKVAVNLPPGDPTSGRILDLWLEWLGRRWAPLLLRSPLAAWLAIRAANPYFARSHRLHASVSATLQEEVRRLRSRRDRIEPLLPFLAGERTSGLAAHRDACLEHAEEVFGIVRGILHGVFLVHGVNSFPETDAVLAHVFDRGSPRAKVFVHAALTRILQAVESSQHAEVACAIFRVTDAEVLDDYVYQDIGNRDVWPTILHWLVPAGVACHKLEPGRPLSYFVRFAEASSRMTAPDRERRLRRLVWDCMPMGVHYPEETFATIPLLVDLTEARDLLLDVVAQLSVIHASHVEHLFEAHLQGHVEWPDLLSRIDHAWINRYVKERGLGDTAAALFLRHPEVRAELARFLRDALASDRSAARLVREATSLAYDLIGSDHPYQSRVGT